DLVAGPAGRPSPRNTPLKPPPQRQGWALPRPHAPPPPQRLRVGLRSTPCSPADLLLSCATVCQIVRRWIGDAADSMVRMLAEVAGRSATNSSIERYSRVNVCLSIATPAKPASENDRSNTCSSARLIVIVVHGDVVQICCPR